MRNTLFLFFLFFLSFTIQAQHLNYAVLDDALIEEIETGQSNSFAIYIMLRDKLDLNELSSSLASRTIRQSEKSTIVLKALKNKASSSQKPILESIRKLTGVSQGSIKSYWICNAIFMEAQMDALIELSQDPRIDWIGIDKELALIDNVGSESVSSPVIFENSLEPGLVAINAPPMWEMGYTGYGQLALVADTGIDPSHPSYSNRYRGYTSSDEQSWFQGEFYDSETPFSCGDHGTHVLGTVLGLDRLTNDTIGVAYDAQWMGSPNLCGGGTSSNLATFEWGADPDNDSNTTDDMADIINNSWWDPGITNSECNSMYIDVLHAVELIGVAVVFSAGNAGPEDSTITPLHNINFDIVNSFTVAAVDVRRVEWEIAGFSSRGPSQCGGEGSILIKPEVAAPGVSVRSAVFEKEYGFKSGTSMAAPHVAGAILLLKEAFPFLSGRDLKLALYYTCDDLGEEGEDNVYGQGMINVKSAYDYLINEGYEPIPPISAENDVILLDISTQKYECNEMLTPEIVFYNNSSSDLTSLKIKFVVDDMEENAWVYDWTGNLKPGKADTIQVDGFDAQEGFHSMTTVLSNPNGQEDLRSLNNTINREVYVSSRKQIEVSTEMDLSPCRGRMFF